MERQRYPIGIETFEKLRNGGYVYIDKTMYIQKLLSRSQYYFLSRPRRFGKSLLLSTLQSFFEGRRDLFEGLAIADYDWDWEPHPVFHLNFVGMSSASKEGIYSLLEMHLSYWEELYGAGIPGLDYSQRFYNVIKNAVEKTGKMAVVLIDEYDKALVSTLENKNLHDEFRSILKPLYSNLKAADKYIRFGMITGVSRFSRLSIFSDVNNLRDISLNDEYAAICGITEKEMVENFREGIELIAEKKRLTFDDALAKLKNYYDGYHFTGESPDLYNPYSLLNALEDCKFKSYWFSTGTPTFLIKELQREDKYLPELFNTQVQETQLADIDSYSKSVVPLLFQTGYLTIKRYDDEDETYYLGLPNKEVEKGFFEDLLPIYAGDDNPDGVMVIKDFCRKIKSGDVEEFLEGLKAFLAGIPYYLSKNKPEVYFENNIYIIFKLMGFNVETEYNTSEGRIDLLVKTKDYIYVIELKLNGTAQEAIDQIEERGYADQFVTDPRKLYKIGISFSHKTRNIDEWIIR